MRAEEQVQQRATFAAALRVREFRVLFVADVLSDMGADIGRIALTVASYQRTGSAAMAALAFTLTFIPYVVGGPFLATFGDRFPRRTVMVVSQFGRAVATVAVVAGLLAGVPIGVLFGVLFVAAFLGPPYESSRSALLPQVLTGDLYVAGNVMAGIVGQVGQIVGYVAGGAAVVLLGVEGALLVDAATFAVAGAMVLRWVRRGDPPAADPAAPRGGVVAMTFEGVRDVFSSPPLRALLLVSLVTLIGAAVPEGLAAVYVLDHGLPSGWTGVLVAAVPIGTAIGGIVLTRYCDHRRRLQLIPAMALLTAVPLVLSGLSLGPAVAFGLWVAVGFFTAFQFAANAAFVQHAPDRILARAMGLAQTLVYVTQVLAIVAAGALAHWLSVEQVVAVGGVVVAVLLVPLLLRWPAGLADAAPPAVPDQRDTDGGAHAADGAPTGEGARAAE